MDDPLRRHASERPDALALRTGSRELTYGELDAEVDAAARRLAARGVRPADRVATTLPAGVDFAALLHACARLGATFVPLPPSAPPAERIRLLEAAPPRLVVEGPLASPEMDLAARAELDEHAPFTVIFTSGTTAAPSPVELTLANHFASARASAENLGVDPGDRWLCVLPPHHVAGLAILLRSAFYGTAAVVHERFEVAAVARDLAAGEATLASLVPTQLARLLDAGLDRPPALRAVLLGGGLVPRELLERATARGIPVLQTYGMTETASQVATLPAWEALDRGHEGSAGRPLRGVELAVASDTGEILVRGPMVAASELAADGWLHTGDRGRLDADGYLWVEGRLDETIVTGGENVSAVEVEDALLSHPAVSEAAVVGRPDPEWGEAVTAYVVLDGAAESPRDEDLVAHVRRSLAPHKVPKRVHRMNGLPRTELGKVARARLRD